MKSAEIQEQINNVETAIQQGASGSHLDLLEMNKSDLKKNLDAALAEEAQQAALVQAHEGRVSDAKEQSNYLLDDILIAGVPVAESGIDEKVFSILRSKIQSKFVSQAESYSDLIKGYEEREVQLQRQNVEIQKDHAELQATHTAYVKEQEQKAYQVELDKTDTDSKLNNAVAQLEEANAEIERLNNQVDEQRKVIALGVSGSLKVVESTDEQIKRQEAELKASRIKVTSMVRSDPSGISDRLWDIVILETGEQKQINYLEKGKYTLIGEEDAARFRQELADKAQREAEQQASIPDLAGDQVVAELDMPSAEVITQEDFRNSDNLATGNEVVHSGEGLGAEHIEEIQAPTGETERRQNSVSREEFEALKGRVDILFQNQEIGSMQKDPAA